MRKRAKIKAADVQKHTNGRKGKSPATVSEIENPNGNAEPTVGINPHPTLFELYHIFALLVQQRKGENYEQYRKNVF